MTDLISRQAAIDAICRACQYDKDDYTDCDDRAPSSTFCDYMNALRHLPSAQPEPEHTMEEFMYGQELGNPEDGSL